MNNFKALLFSSAVMLTPFAAQSDILINNMGGEHGFGVEANSVYNVYSSQSVDLPFELNFFNQSYNQLTFNQQGVINMGGEPMDYWSELSINEYADPSIHVYRMQSNLNCWDCDQTSQVFVGNPSEDSVAITWYQMEEPTGWWQDEPPQTTAINSVQAVIIDRSMDTGVSGDFDIEFRYEQLEYSESWHFFEVPAEASAGVTSGFLAMDLDSPLADTESTQIVALPGSGTSEILELANTSNVGETGLWAMSFRDGEFTNPVLPNDGSSSTNPVLPIDVVDGAWEFELEVVENEIVFIDPDVAIGYDYVVESGPNMASVILPAGFDANYELWLMGANGWEFTDNLFADQEYTFVQGGVSEFRILGIDTSNMINPEDSMAFVTGLSFVGSGDVVMTQAPITEFVADPTRVNEPSPLFLLLAGLGFIALRARKKQA